METRPDPMDLREERAVGGDPSTHWYYIAKGRAIKSLLGDAAVESVLDVGAGSGVFSRLLVEEGLAGRALCIDPHYTDAEIAATGDVRIARVRAADRPAAPLVLMIDVIEHVDDDVGLVSLYAETAPPGARFLISVPAFDLLWSSHDDFLEHRRRYSTQELHYVVERSGLELIDTRYFFGLLFPAVAALRLADRAMKGDREAKESALKAAPGWLNDALVAIHDFERRTLFPVNRLAGVTAFALARKPLAKARSAA